MGFDDRYVPKPARKVCDYRGFAIYTIGKRQFGIAGKSIRVVSVEVAEKVIDLYLEKKEKFKRDNNG